MHLTAWNSPFNMAEPLIIIKKAGVKLFMQNMDVFINQSWQTYNPPPDIITVLAPI